MPQPYLYTSLRMEAMIGLDQLGPQGPQGPQGVVFDVLSYSGDFQLNTIPQLQLVLAVGRKANDPNLAAAVHEYAKKMRQLIPVQVYFYPEGQFDHTNAWPPGPHLIWDGYLSGTGFRNSGTNMVFVVYCIHWLDDMDFSSSLTRWTHPMNTSEYAFQTVHVQMEAGVGTPSFISSTLPSEFITADLIKEDLWGCVIQPWFCELSRYDTIAMVPEDSGVTHGNSSALVALSRMQGSCAIGAQGPQACGAEPGPYHTSLSLDNGTNDENALADGISNHIATQTLQSFASHTLWDKLIEFANDYLFAVVPMINTALVVPYIAGTRTPFKTICADQYSYIDLTASVQRPLKACVLFGGQAFATGIAITDDGFVEWTEPGGYYAAAGGSGARAPDKGMILIKQAPPWLANIGSADEHAAYSTQGPQGTLPTDTTVDPEITEPASAYVPSAAVAAAQAEGSVVSRYAHAMFVQETLRGRQGVLLGKLRFDIAPGSTVKIQGAGDAHIKTMLEGADALNADLWAQVLRVSVFIDAEAARAHTVLHIAYQRAEDENSDQRSSLAAHPLYLKEWTGAPLVEALIFADDPCE